MKAKVLKDLLQFIDDDEEVYLAEAAHDYWHNINVNPVRRVEAETVVWDETRRTYKLLQGGQSVADYQNDQHPVLRVIVLK